MSVISLQVLSETCDPILANETKKKKKSSWYDYSVK